MDTWYELVRDVRSVFHHIGLIAKAGEKVKIIYSSEPACIVENEKGERYATRLENLQESSTIKQITPESWEEKKSMTS